MQSNPESPAHNPVADGKSPMKSVTDGLSAVIAVVGFVGPLVYSIWAMCGTPAEPAASYIDWQARWGDGRYGLKATFLATWLTVMIPFALLWAVYWTGSELLRVKQTPNAPAPTTLDWVSLPATNAMLSVVGVVFGLISLTGYSVLATNPESLSFVGWGAAVVFMLLPIFFYCGLAGFLNLVLPSRTLMGSITALKQRTGDKGQVIGYVVVLDKKEFSLPQQTWAKLQVGQVIYLRAPSLSDSVRDLRVQTAVHYR